MFQTYSKTLDSCAPRPSCVSHCLRFGREQNSARGCLIRVEERERTRAQLAARCSILLGTEGALWRSLRGFGIAWYPSSCSNVAFGYACSPLRGTVLVSHYRFAIAVLIAEGLWLDRLCGSSTLGSCCLRRQQGATQARSPPRALHSFHSAPFRAMLAMFPIRGLCSGHHDGPSRRKPPGVCLSFLPKVRPALRGEGTSQVVVARVRGDTSCLLVP